MYFKEIAMINSREINPTNREQSPSQPATTKIYHIGEVTNQLLKDAKKLGSEIYGEGMEKFNGLQHEIKQYSDQFSHKVHQRPLTALCLAAGVGFVLSRLFFRR